jgi:hypothetical protein
MRKIETILTLAAIGGSLAVATPARAQLACGGTVGPGGTFVLADDLDCRDDPACETPGSCSPALTVVGNAVLDLNGKTVTCSSGDDDGIVLEGTAGVVRDGTVALCFDGVRLAGTGRHVVRRVVALRSKSDGFQVESGGNRLEEDVADTSLRNGFNVSGGDGNQLLRNVATRTGRFNGFNVSGSRDNLLRYNVASANAVNGFNVSSAGNRVLDGIAFANGGRGIAVNGDQNVVRRSLVSSNETGIDAFGTGNVLERNTVLANEAVDMEDEAACDDLWRRNVFGTSTPPGCVR